MKSLCFILLVMSASVTFADESKKPSFSASVEPVFRKYCVGCHNAEEAEGELNLENFAGLMRGGENGPVLVPGKVDKSRLVLLLEKKAEPFMPPEGEKAPTPAEIGLLKAWIQSGAAGPAKGASTRTLPVIPKIKLTGPLRRPVNAVSFSPDGKWIAVASYREVEILSGKDRKPLTTLTGHQGNVNDVGFSADGKRLFVAAGEAGLFGEAVIWNTADWSKILKFSGHRDSLYAAAISPDGKLLATGSYDQKIKIWDAVSGKEIRELTGHNGAVFDLAFHPSGKILASASGDRTVKLWDVATGTRLDTLSQPTKGQNTVAFSPNGRYVAAGGIDHRIRVWEVQQMGKEGTNPILFSRFGHQSAILKLAFSPNGQVLVSSSEDRTIKFWETGEFTLLRTLDKQSDWPTAIAIGPNSSTLLAGRLDGTLTSYPIAVAGDKKADEAAPLEENTASKRPQTPSESRKPTKLTEVEPNNLPNQATPVTLPATISGVLMASKDQAEDADLFRIDARAGEAWILETKAERDKSPADTKIEVLHADGKPVERLLLRAVRDSTITFRPIDSKQSGVRTKNWREMKLNQFLYMGGEVCRIFRMPRGPDSGFVFYTSKGSRRCYFDTSGTVHARDEDIYVVESFPPGTKLTDNGLPVFPLFFANDDDGDRELGRDSRLTFTAPADGSYLVRVTDVRGFSGADFKYSLSIRQPKPDFHVTIAEKNITVAAGSGRRISIRLDRSDNYDGEVRVEFAGLPPGFTVSSPVVVEAGHLKAQGVINVAADVPPTKTDSEQKDDKAVKKKSSAETADSHLDWPQVVVTASALIDGKTVKKNVKGGLGTIKVAEKPKYTVRLLPDRVNASAPAAGQPHELVIQPGKEITAMLKIERNGYDGELRFDIDNLPHGVIVGHLGLSGIMIRAGEVERQIFITAADWVPETTRQIHAVSSREGKEASPPILFHVRSADQIVSAPGASSNEPKASK